MYSHTPVHVCAVWCLQCFVQSCTCACWCKFLLLVSCANMHCCKMQLLLPARNSDYSYVHARVLISLTIQRTGSMLSTCAHTCISVRLAERWSCGPQLQVNILSSRWLICYIQQTTVINTSTKLKVCQSTNIDIIEFTKGLTAHVTLHV